MKGLKKLVLASAIIAASSSAFAMQPMDEESMSATTGQDGLTITLDTALTNLNIKYIDRDGVLGSGYANAGGIIIDPVDVTANDLTIDIDAGGSVGDTSGDGMLQIAIGTGSATVIGLGGTTIAVADADATGSATGTATDIITFDATASLTIAASANLATIQLGNEDQGAMINVNASLGTITLTGLAINDANSGGAIGIGTLVVNSLVAVNAIDVVAGGLQINTAGTTIGEIGLERVKLGDVSALAPSIGDIYISNLNPSTVITVTGH